VLSGGDDWTEFSRRVTMLVVSIAGTYLAEIDTPDIAWERESVAELSGSLSDDRALTRDDHLVRCAAHPVVPFAIKLAAGQWPGQDACDDAEWAATAALARRRLTVSREARIEFASGEIALGLLDWIDAQIGTRDDHDFPALVRSRVDGLMNAGQRGRERANCWTPKSPCYPTATTNSQPNTPSTRQLK
jgi:hypothetical protein